MRVPLVIAAIHVNADTSQREEVLLREMRHNETHVAFLPDHWMSAIGVTLSGPLTAVGVNVGHHGHLLAATKVPQRHRASAVEDNDAGVKRSGIEIVVADELS